MPDVKHLVKTLLSTYAEMKPDEVREKLLDLREEVDDLVSENEKLKEENRDLTVRLKRRKELEREGDAYYLLEENGKKTGPLCPHCYEESGIVHMLARSHGVTACLACGSRYPGVSVKLSVPGSQMI